MLYHPNKNYLLLLVCTSLLLGQAKTNMSFFQSDKYVLGGFMNVDADGLDFELLANAESEIGLYSNIWLSQIDYYSNTDVQSNFSIGYNKKLTGRLLLDIGYSHNHSFGETSSENPEVYFGIDLNNFSIWAFAGNDGTSFESWFKPNIDALSESNIDLLLYGFIEQDGYDLSINISSQLTNKIIAGVMMDYENYNRKNEITFTKNDQTKSKIFIDSYSGVSAMLYFGFLFNQ